MNFTIMWYDIPESVRRNFIDRYDIFSQDVDLIKEINIEMHKFNGFYSSMSNTAHFKTENHYKLFVLKWV